MSLSTTVSCCVAPFATVGALGVTWTVTTRATRIDPLAFGPFVVRNVPASLNPGMGDMQVLLGMSVLRHLEFSQRGDTLILRPAGG